ncbi:MAG TPA: hypothetical protein VL484_13450 [Vicinamibacterales bacterium]|nr:hypothetical protein [Vicinamibacterales bacterium]
MNPHLGGSFQIVAAPAHVGQVGRELRVLDPQSLDFAPAGGVLVGCVETRDLT